MTQRSAIGALHCAVLLFGLTGVLGKLADSSPAIIVFGRAAFAVLALSLCAGLLGRVSWQPLNHANCYRLTLGGLLLAGHWMSFFIAVNGAGVAIATLGFASFPAFTVLLEGLIFRERIRHSEIGLIALVSLGLLLVTPDFDLASTATSGLLWAVLSGLLFALLSLVNRSGVGKLTPAQAALGQNLLVTCCLLPFAAPGLPDLPALSWLWLALLGVFCTAVGHWLFVASLSALKARTAAVAFALEPVYGISFAWLIFAQAPSLRMLVGAALIMLAILLSVLRPAHSARPSAAVQE
ncbi:MAG: DMT family transporter [Pseudomonas sp.]|uniref:DMT family transporter n=1 Tax=Pseudomonas sp. TaxID=306 RepID=UPI0027330021|nr:DMT family transporter [Pseudomonas sp.]MDP3846133.1 DMT family transporter [Pseudomonas sp.]